MTLPCLACPNARHGACRRLTPEDRAALGQRAHRLVLPRGETLARREPEYSVLLSGYLARVAYGRDGRRRSLGLVLPGEAICGAARRVHR